MICLIMKIFFSPHTIPARLLHTGFQSNEDFILLAGRLQMIRTLLRFALLIPNFTTTTGSCNSPGGVLAEISSLLVDSNPRY
jgi:hypothetical protein